MNGSRNCSGQISPKQEISCSEIHKNMLGKLIDYLICPLVLAYPKHDQLYVLHIDASQLGLGAVLYLFQYGT